MAKEIRRRRPKKVMMLAINAKIAGQKSEAESLIREHGLDRKEIETRIELRGGKPYDLGPGKRKAKPRRAAKRTRRPSQRRAAAVPQIGDGTTTLSLLQLERRVAQLLAAKPKAEVAKAREALSTLEEYRRKVEAAEALLEQMD